MNCELSQRLEWLGLRFRRPDPMYLSQYKNILLCLKNPTVFLKNLYSRYSSSKTKLSKKQAWITQKIENDELDLH